MAEFLKGNSLNSKLDEILEKAEEKLYLMSPFIKFHSRIKEILLTKKEKDRLQLVVVYGKNEDNKEKSLGQEDFEFLTQFRNVCIKYEPRLHAKYYANEGATLLSSMNLYEYSQNNNIEFGIYSEASTFMDKIIGSKDTIDKDAWDYFLNVLDNAETVYRKDPVYEKKLFGLTEKYVKSDVAIDTLTTLYGNVAKKSNSNQVKVKEREVKFEPGYCIRTGVKIPFNVERPFSDQAYKSWARFKDDKYEEKYCHYSGEPSEGKTSMAKPILHKNWKKANL